MVLDAVSNFVRGNLSASVTDTDTTFPVNDASIYPDPSADGEYNVVVWDASTYPRPDQDPAVEVARVTARDTTNDELTVTRGQEGTSGASHPSGSAVHLSPTAKMFSDIETTFGNFWDSANQELTADVNNSVVNTEFVYTGSSGERDETTTVDTSATTIFEADPNETGLGSGSTYICFVTNADSGDEQFSDIIQVWAGNYSVISKQSRTNAPNRTYNVPSGATVPLELSFGSGQYDVKARGSGFIENKTLVTT